jgi:anti-sigma-K factor RskA
VHDAPAHDSSAHPPEWALEQMAEGELPPEEQRAISTHVEACHRCAAELEAFRTLFAALSSLPRFAPTPGFGDAVMARVQVAPAPSAVTRWLQRWIPSTRRGWVLVAAASAIPALPLLALVAWILSRPAVSPAALEQWASERTQAAAQHLFAYLLDWGLGSGALGLAQSAWGALSGVPLEALSATLVFLAIAIPLSAWSLVRLVRTPNVDVTYAS